MEKKIAIIEIKIFGYCDSCKEPVELLGGIPFYRVVNILDDLNKGKPTGIPCPRCSRETIFEDYSY